MTSSTAPSSLPLLPDWADAGGVVLRAVAAEAATAELAWRADPDCRWRGGPTHGADIVGLLRRDAKAVRTDRDGDVVLARRNAQPYDPAIVDCITLAHMGEASTGFAVDLERGVVQLTAEVPIEALYDIPTAQINSLMPIHGYTDPNWRNVLLDPATLEPHRVH